MTKKNWRSFAEARKFVQSLKLKLRDDWLTYCKTNKKPGDIPASPNTVYKDEWIDWGDFLGTNFIPNRNRSYLSYEDARKYVRSLKLKNTIDWNKYCNSKKLPANIPRNPQKIYKDEWTTWKYFIGNEFLSFKEASKFVQKLGLKSQTQYEKWCKDGNRPSFIPATPSKTFKLKGTWTGWGDFLGTGRIADREKAENFLQPEEAGPVIQKLREDYGLKNKADWTRFARTHKKLLEELRLPVNILQTYSLKRAKKRMKK
jgi:hypothetical protein